MFIETAGAGSRAAAAHKTVSRRCPGCCLLNHPNYWNTGSWPMENIQIQTFKPSGCCCCCCDSLLAGRCCVDILIDNEEGDGGGGATGASAAVTRPGHRSPGWRTKGDFNENITQYNYTELCFVRRSQIGGVLQEQRS